MIEDEEAQRIAQLLYDLLKENGDDGAMVIGGVLSGRTALDGDYNLIRIAHALVADAQAQKQRVLV